MLDLTQDNGLYSRETLAGYDPAVLERAVLVLPGAGAAGNNIAQSAALVGFGEIRIADFDEVEASNLTRSPLFARDERAGVEGKPKAKIAAQALRPLMYASSARLRYAVAKIEALGLGAIADATVVVSAVDTLAGRAYLADATRLLGIPLVEVGFRWPRGHVTVFPNDEPSAPCWRCSVPTAQGGISCRTLAQAAVAQGFVPTTQTIAAFTSALVVEAAIQAAHGRFPLGGRMLEVNVRDGDARLIELAADPECPGAHRRLGPRIQLATHAGDRIEALLEEVARYLPEPTITLPVPFLVAAPCSRCGARVSVGKPAYAIAGPPSCRACPALPQLDGTQIAVLHEVGPKLPQHVREKRCVQLGLPALAVFEATSAVSGEQRAFQLAGHLEELFREIPMRRGNGAAMTGMKTDDGSNAEEE